MVGADVFLGLSVADVVTPKMIKSMAKNPVVFAMANPNPELLTKMLLLQGKILLWQPGAAIIQTKLTMYWDFRSSSGERSM